MRKVFPKISIITPSFNQGKFIKKTIDSVLSQNYPDLEYVVIDGGSTDNTVKILKSYGNKIKWISEKDKGQADAINKGLKIINGEIIAFINSDDYYLPDTFKKIVDFFKQNITCNVVTGDYLIINENGKPIQSFVGFYKNFLRKFNSFNLLSIANYINQPSTFWKKKVFNKVGFFNESLKYTMDYDYWLRILKNKFKICIVNDKFAAFRIHSNSKGGCQYTFQFNEEQSVQKKYNNKFIINILHSIHNMIVINIYRFIK